MGSNRLIYREALQSALAVRSGPRPAPPKPKQTWGFDYAVWRLLTVLGDGPLSVDSAILLRQCLRYLGANDQLVVRHLAADLLDLLRVVGVEQLVDGTIVAEPYKPQWINESPAPEVDAPARERVTPEEEIPAEPWLEKRVGKRFWKSSAQREATWLALQAEPNATLMIGLPTGSGKSLVYQAAAAFESGLTLVIVPTVALGLDQRDALKESPLAQTHRPLLYATGENQTEVLEAVEERRCRLLITSPEACTNGRLRAMLTQMAHEGWLSLVVVDEAHIIESWGASFRIEFQLLGGLIAAWRNVGPRGVRALLLSATFTTSTAEVLKRLFWKDGTPWVPFVLKRLRPEIEYFSPGDRLSPGAKHQHLMEAIHRLPRPAIVYVTEKKEAESIYRTLWGMGLRRMRTFHGDTSPPARYQVMDEWRTDRLDLVIATSAFGMGVDKADVRCVVHACYPENIDRFYQEVGRGGRDGAPTISIALWTKQDVATAAGLGPKLLADQTKIVGRWEALWATSVALAELGRFRVRLDAQPSHLLGARSYEENSSWNKRLLMMMQRAGVIRVEALKWDAGPDDEWVQSAVIVPERNTLEIEKSLPQMLAWVRKSEMATLNQGRQSLDIALGNRQAVCRILRKHYGADTKRACGSCAGCRSGSDAPARVALHEVEFDLPPGQPTVDVVEAPSPRTAKGRAALILGLRRVLLANGTASRFIVSTPLVSDVRTLFERAAEGVDHPFRVDSLDVDVAESIGPLERTVVLHFETFHQQAKGLNRRGRRCSHWLLGQPIENPPGMWPFLHDFRSRPFQGADGLDRWLASYR